MTTTQEMTLCSMMVSKTRVERVAANEVATLVSDGWRYLFSHKVFERHVFKLRHKSKGSYITIIINPRTDKGTMWRDSHVIKEL